MDVYRGIQAIYNSTIRESLPEKCRTLADVEVQDTPLFDLHADNPMYKIGLILSIYDYVSTGDRVEIVGFGRGVTTTHIFWAGATEVIGYDGAANMIKKGVDTVKRNVDDIPSLRVKHSIIGDPIDVYGNFSDAEIVPPSELSGADVLMLDCEGAEKSILSGLGTLPSTIICESHPTKGAPAEEIIKILDAHYEVTLRSHKPKPDAKQVIIGIHDS